jgi:NAD(P)H-hydrate epimerase
MTTDRSRHPTPWSPPDLDAALPWLTAEQMVEVDRAMVDDLGVTLLQMMELAGRHLAWLAQRRFLVEAAPGPVVVLVGPGGNGGGALVAARRLSAWGADVHVVLGADEARFSDTARHHLAIARRFGLAQQMTGALPDAPVLVIDGLIGYGLSGAPRDRIAERIHWATQVPAPVLALDVPSGLDATTGVAAEAVIAAAATLTLALPKCGLGVEGRPDLVGELYLADIGVPPALYARPPLSLHVPNVFAEADVVRLR